MQGFGRAGKDFTLGLLSRSLNELLEEGRELEGSGARAFQTPSCSESLLKSASAFPHVRVHARNRVVQGFLVLRGAGCVNRVKLT